MIIGIGIDVADISRFAAALERTPSMRERLFTPAERELHIQSLAARFAAKEAIAKALGAPGNLEWQRRPAKARRLFQNDLDRWKVMGTTPDTAIVAEQDAWVAQQHHDRFAENAATTPAYQAPDTSTQRLIDDVSSLDVDRQRT